MEWTPILLSMKLAVVTTLILVVAGVPLAYWLSGKSRWYKVAAETFLTMPLVLPPSVLGFYLLLAFSPRNAFGQWLQETVGVQFVFSFGGLVIASIIYSAPFLIGPVRSALDHLPASLAEASYTMGKSPVTTFFSVLLPNIRTSVLTAAVLTFAHTLGEFGVVLMIGGNIPGVTRVASIAVYDAVEQQDFSKAAQYSWILFLVTFLIVAGVTIAGKKRQRGAVI
jgi:molybdate transport system permease protein